MTGSPQLTLPVQLPDQAVFESFFPGGNEVALEHLKSLAQTGNERLIWIWGSAGCGKTHLLQATCAEASRHGRHATYLPLGTDVTPEMLDGLEVFSLLCLDDIHAVAGEPDWEAALFALFNRVSEANGALLVSSVASSSNQAFALADLRSRMTWGPVYRIEPVREEALPAAMAHRAMHRGLQLPEETSRFLLRRFPRDMRSIYRLLDTLDLASLRAQRRLTVPFVREVLRDGQSGA